MNVWDKHKEKVSGVYSCRKPVICKDFAVKLQRQKVSFFATSHCFLMRLMQYLHVTHTQHAVIRKSPHVQTSPSASSNSFWGLQESNTLHHILLKAFITQRDTQRAAGAYWGNASRSLTQQLLEYNKTSVQSGKLMQACAPHRQNYGTGLSHFVFLLYHSPQ